jgi:hypothetical protein
MRTTLKLLHHRALTLVSGIALLALRPGFLPRRWMVLKPGFAALVSPATPAPNRG